MKIVILFVVFVAMVNAENCGGNCPSGKCPNCPCGTTPVEVDVNAICARYSWSQECCKCIVMKESAGNGNAMNYNTDDTFDVGVFQINKVNWACNGGNPPCALEPNLKCAIMVYQAAGSSWKLWTTAKDCGCA